MATDFNVHLVTAWNCWIDIISWGEQISSHSIFSNTHDLSGTTCKDGVFDVFLDVGNLEGNWIHLNFLILFVKVGLKEFFPCATTAWLVSSWVPNVRLNIPSSCLSGGHHHTTFWRHWLFFPAILCVVVGIVVRTSCGDFPESYCVEQWDGRAKQLADLHSW